MRTVQHQKGNGCVPIVMLPIIFLTVLLSNRSSSFLVQSFDVTTTSSSVSFCKHNGIPSTSFRKQRHHQQQRQLEKHHKRKLTMLKAGIDPTTIVPLTMTATSTTATPTATMDPLLTYLLQTIITNGVPAAFSIIVFGFIAWQLKSIVTANRDNNSNNRNSNAYTTSLSLLYDDIYGDQDQDPLKRNGGGGPFGGNMFNNRNRFPSELPKNVGVPKLQYIKVTHLNPKYDSYQYSIVASTQSKVAAANQYRQLSYQRAWGKIFSDTNNYVNDDDNDSSDENEATLTSYQIQQLVQLEQEFIKTASQKQAEIQSMIVALQRKSIDDIMSKSLNMESVYQIDPNTNINNTSTTKDKVQPKGGSLMKFRSEQNRDISGTSKAVSPSSLSTVQTELIQLEMKLIDNIIKVVGPKYAATIRTIVLGNQGDVNNGLTQLLLSSSTERPLTQLLLGHSSLTSNNDDSSPKKKKIYVTRFPGDVSASQVRTLREEITAILQSQPRPNVDEVIVILQTGGGTVTGYGLAAAQLQRIKDANIHLTIAVEQVAASGGYMMACIADTIVASPFAVLGSIGVISDIPNVYERLKNEGIEFQTVTAGKYKRTLTPTKKVTKEDYQKSKEDIESVFGLFRDFVKLNRPILDIDQVATGETWFGTAALERKLCDGIQTVDDLLLSKIKDGHDVYEVMYKPPPAIDNTLLGQLLQPASSDVSVTTGPIRTMIRWLVTSIVQEVRSELLSGGQDMTSSRYLDDPQSPSTNLNRYMAVDDTADRIRSQID